VVFQQRLNLLVLLSIEKEILHEIEYISLIYVYLKHMKNLTKAKI